MPDDQLGFRPFERNEQDPTPRVLLVKERRREVAPPGRWRERCTQTGGCSSVAPRSCSRGLASAGDPVRLAPAPAQALGQTPSNDQEEWMVGRESVDGVINGNVVDRAQGSPSGGWPKRPARGAEAIPGRELRGGYSPGCKTNYSSRGRCYP